MKLQLACITFKGAHFDDASLFEEIESHHIVANFLAILDFTGQWVHYIDQIVALTEYFVNLGATMTELASDSISDAVHNDLGVRLITNTVNIVFGNHLVESWSCSLQVVQSVPHISFCSENERLDTLNISL